jgi:hypothetical protein
MDDLRRLQTRQFDAGVDVSNYRLISLANLLKRWKPWKHILAD